MSRFPLFYCKQCRKDVWSKWSWLWKAWICPFCLGEVKE